MLSKTSRQRNLWNLIRAIIGSSATLMTVQKEISIICNFLVAPWTWIDSSMTFNKNICYKKLDGWNVLTNSLALFPASCWAVSIDHHRWLWSQHVDSATSFGCLLVGKAFPYPAAATARLHLIQARSQIPIHRQQWWIRPSPQTPPG